MKFQFFTGRRSDQFEVHPHEEPSVNGGKRMDGRLGCDTDCLVLKKLIYLVRRELKLIRLNMRFLSRRIGFPNIARIIGFGSRRMDQSYNILWSRTAEEDFQLLAITLNLTN